jgi:glucokinase
VRPPFVVGIDLGASTLRACLLDDCDVVLAAERRPTAAQDYPATLQAMAALVRRLGDQVGGLPGKIAAVGVAAAAFLNRDRSHVMHAANLGWHAESLRDDLQALVEAPVVLSNDADAAAWAEFLHRDDQRTVADLVVVTVGTGLGAGVVTDGRLLTGARGLAGELGHVPVVQGGRECPCGGRGCLEQYVSGTALQRAARHGAQARPEEARTLLRLAGGDAKNVTGHHVMAAAADGDPVAREAFDEIGRWLGVGIALVVAVTDPCLVAIGGGLAAAGELLLGPARQAFGVHVGVPALHADCELRIAHLADEAGMRGAAAIARAAVAGERPL